MGAERWAEACATLGALAGLRVDECVAGLAPELAAAVRRASGPLDELRAAASSREERARALARVCQAQQSPQRTREARARYEAPARVAARRSAGARVARALLAALPPAERAQLARRLAPSDVRALQVQAVEPLRSAPPLEPSLVAALLRGLTLRARRAPTLDELGALLEVLRGDDLAAPYAARAALRTLRSAGRLRAVDVAALAAVAP